MKVIKDVKYFDENGYVYKQLIEISKENMIQFNKYILTNLENIQNQISCAKRSFVTPLELKENGFIYTSHTMRNLFSDFFNIKIDDENTVLHLV